MFNLNVKTTRVVTTDDLELYSDPPLTFEAVGRINNALHQELVAWSKEGYTPNQAALFVPKLFLSVSLNGNTYPLVTLTDAEALRAAVGDEWLTNLIEAYWDYEYNYFKKKRLASANSQTPPAGGDGSEPKP